MGRTVVGRLSAVVWVVIMKKKESNQCGHRDDVNVGTYNSEEKARAIAKSMGHHWSRSHNISVHKSSNLFEISLDQEETKSHTKT